MKFVRFVSSGTPALKVSTNTSRLRSRAAVVGLLASAILPAACGHSAELTGNLRADAQNALKKAATYYHDNVANRGGYNYFYSLDLKQAWGEGIPNADQIFVQPPGTPAVGMAYLEAYEATGDRDYLTAARDAGQALIYGQLQSGGWTQKVDFNPEGNWVNQYRNGRGKGPNHSSLDDDQTQATIKFLARLDKAQKFKDPVLHEAVGYALEALMKAQFPNGGFPQGWKEPVTAHPVLKATYPKNWPRVWPKEGYSRYYTLNDGLVGTISDTLLTAIDVYQDARYKQALTRLGDFLILAQMPDPQPAWAQQYNYEMQPAWARKFEPPAIAGLESEDAIKTLMKIYRVTGDRKYLAPIPKAIAYLKKSRRPDGRMERYHELETNKPLYMNRLPGVSGSSSAPGYYFFTYEDKNLPSHYGWIQNTQIDELEKEYQALQSGKVQPKPQPSAAALEPQVRQIVRELDDQGRWIATYDGERLVGQPRFQKGFQYLNMGIFNRNVELLSNYLAASRS